MRYFIPAVIANVLLIVSAMLLSKQPTCDPSHGDSLKDVLKHCGTPLKIEGRVESAGNIRMELRYANKTVVIDDDFVLTVLEPT